MLFSPSTTLGGAANVTRGLRFQAITAVSAGQQVTITAPTAGDFTPNSTFAVALDLTAPIC